MINKSILAKIRNIVQKYLCKETPSCDKMLFLDDINNSLMQSRGNLLIVFPIIDWNFRWQRPQHITSRFAENGYTVLYLAMNIRPQGRIYQNKEEASNDISFSRLADHVYSLGLSSQNQFNVYVDKLQGADLTNMHLGLTAVFSALSGVKNISYMLHFPGWSPLAFKMRESSGGKVIFDCMDDHSGFSTNTAESLKEEQSLLKNADLVITSSFLLEKKAHTENSNTILAKNGTDFVHFNTALRNGELEALTDKPIIGYYGAISDWFDMEIVEYCAKEKPEWNFVLIGSTFGCNIEKADKLANVHFLGEKPYKDLPGYFAYFDVCTIPFKIIPLTLATNPVKFYEYLSGGKPVVSVELPELEQYKEYCYLAKNKEDFVHMLEKALLEKDNTALVKERIALAKDNSWDQRFQVIESAVRTLHE